MAKNKNDHVEATSNATSPNGLPADFDFGSGTKFGARVHDWDKILNGEVNALVEGVDYRADQKLTNFINSIRVHARIAQKNVKIRRVTEGEQIGDMTMTFTGLVVQAQDK